MFWWIKHWPFNLASRPARDLEINEFTADTPIPADETSHQNAPTYNLSRLASATKKRARSDLVQRCNHLSPSCWGWEYNGDNPETLSSLGL